MNLKAQPHPQRSRITSQPRLPGRHFKRLAALDRYFQDSVAMRVFRWLLLASILSGSAALAVAHADELPSPAIAQANAALAQNPGPTNISEFRFNLRGPTSTRMKSRG